MRASLRLGAIGLFAWWSLVCTACLSADTGAVSDADVAVPSVDVAASNEADFGLPLPPSRAAIEPALVGGQSYVASNTGLVRLGSSDSNSIVARWDEATPVGVGSNATGVVAVRVVGTTCRVSFHPLAGDGAWDVALSGAVRCAKPSLTRDLVLVPALRETGPALEVVSLRQGELLTHVASTSGSMAPSALVLVPDDVLTPAARMTTDAGFVAPNNSLWAVGAGSQVTIFALDVSGATQQVAAASVPAGNVTALAIGPHGRLWVTVDALSEGGLGRSVLSFDLDRDGAGSYTLDAGPVSLVTDEPMTAHPLATPNCLVGGSESTWWCNGNVAPQGVVFGATQSRIFAWAADTGGLVWSHPTGAVEIVALTLGKQGWAYGSESTWVPADDSTSWGVSAYRPSLGSTEVIPIVSGDADGQTWASSASIDCSGELSLVLASTSGMQLALGQAPSKGLLTGGWSRPHGDNPSSGQTVSPDACAPGEDPLTTELYAGLCAGPAAGLNPGDIAWRELPPMSISRGYGCAGYRSGQLFAVSGVNSDTPSQFKDGEWSAETLVMGEEAWQALPQPPQWRVGSSCVFSGADLYVVGGRGPIGIGADNVASVLVYSTATQTWSNGPNLPNILAFSSAFEQDGYIYLVGGVGIGYQSRVWRLDPGVGTWESAGDLNAPRYGVASTPLAGGMLALGGSAFVGPGEQTEVRSYAAEFSRGDGVWSIVGEMSDPLTFATAVVSGGRLYLAHRDRRIDEIDLDTWQQIPRSSQFEVPNTAPTSQTHALTPLGPVFVGGGTWGPTTSSVSLACVVR